MVKRASIEFVPVDKPITELVSKFGGQPVWLTEPQWPLSRSTGRPMQFICQIALTPDLFGQTEAQGAYLFMTDDAAVDDTWAANGGENAIILQPGQPTVLTQPLQHGPSLYARVPIPGKKLLQSQPVEFAVNLQLSDDPDFVSESVLLDWPDEQAEDYSGGLLGNKLGGTPHFIQNEEFPISGKSHLLLQLDATTVPFFINFGDAGIGYGFISENGREGKFLWQCS